jgi:hypothetical protein
MNAYQKIFKCDYCKNEIPKGCSLYFSFKIKDYGSFEVCEECSKITRKILKIDTSTLSLKNYFVAFRDNKYKVFETYPKNKYEKIGVISKNKYSKYLIKSLNDEKNCGMNETEIKLTIEEIMLKAEAIHVGWKKEKPPEPFKFLSKSTNREDFGYHRTNFVTFGKNIFDILAEIQKFEKWNIPKLVTAYGTGKWLHPETLNGFCTNGAEMIKWMNTLQKTVNVDDVTWLPTPKFIKNVIEEIDKKLIPLVVCKDKLRSLLITLENDDTD